MPETNISLHDIAQFLESQWFKKTGLIAAVIATISGELLWLVGVGVAWWVTLTTIVGSALFIFFVWWKSSLPPSTTKNKIGFLISIACSDDVEAKKLREDFVIPLRQLIKSGQTGGAFHFMELPQHLAHKVVDEDEAQAIRVHSRAHFMLYGRVRLRSLDGIEHHIIELEGIVAHKPVPDRVQESLTREFTELLPRRVRLATDNDLLTFQFTSEWADIVAKYIIGIAAAHSGDLIYAEKLYMDAATRLAGKDTSFPVYSKLAQRIPLRISELYEARARAVYDKWAIDHDSSHVENLGHYLAKVDESRKSDPSVLNLLSIHTLLSAGDADAALEILKRSSDTNNAVWHYNIAFLYCYKGDLKSATRHYRQGTHFELAVESISQIEDFMCWLLQQQPEKCQLEYGLGYFNWKVKGDVLQAKKDFEGFLKHCVGNDFPKEKELAAKWIGAELASRGLEK